MGKFVVAVVIVIQVIFDYCYFYIIIAVGVATAAFVVVADVVASFNILRQKWLKAMTREY